MAEIYPFRGITYSSQRVGAVDNAVSQPYDKISPRMAEEYLHRSPYNIARVILSAPEGSDLQAHFRGVADTFNSWLTEGILVPGAMPRLYPYYQTYRIPGTDKVCTRKSVVGLGKLYDYSEGVIRPHEKTHSGPKLDRLMLTRATGCQFGLLFMLYPDREARVNSILDEALAGQEPVIGVVDENGVKHRMWEIEDSEKIGQVQRIMSDKKLYIADGHHRYETALTYWREQAASGGPPAGGETIDRAMMAFVSIHDEALSVLPTHRLVFALPDFDPAGLLISLEAHFQIEELGPKSESNLIRALEANSSKTNSMIFAAKDQDNLYSLKLKPSVSPSALIPGEGSEVWKSLDVNILHKLIFEPHLGINEKDLEYQTKVNYYRGAGEALAQVTDSGSKYQAAFFLNSSRVEDVVEVADRGECMPQKSTDFYPKMMTGLVINKLNLK